MKMLMFPMLNVILFVSLIVQVECLRVDEQLNILFMVLLKVDHHADNSMTIHPWFLRLHIKGKERERDRNWVWYYMELHTRQVVMWKITFSLPLVLPISSHKHDKRKEIKNLLIPKIQMKGDNNKENKLILTFSLISSIEGEKFQKKSWRKKIIPHEEISILKLTMILEWQKR